MAVWKRFAVPTGAVLMIALSGAACAEVTVRFVEPARYADAGASEGGRARNLSVLERHLRAAARTCVADDERLDIDVRDVDLAGDVDGSRPDATELRVLRDVSAPRMELDWVLADAHGQAVARGHEQVSDMDYLENAARARFSREMLPYERLMLEHWAQRRLCRPPR